jgi:hypothetical protein
MRIRPGWRTIDVISWSAMVGMFIAFACIWPAQAGTYLSGPVLIGLVAWIRMRSLWLEVTDSAVLVRQGGLRGKRDRQTPRDAITAIHYFPNLISFRGPHNGTITMITPNYTRRQMLRVAEMLDIPLYDHTRWLGLRKVRVGRLAYDPGSGQPAAQPDRGYGTGMSSETVGNIWNAGLGVLQGSVCGRVDAQNHGNC